jgi:hypothetical protein
MVNDAVDAARYRVLRDHARTVDYSWWVAVKATPPCKAHVTSGRSSPSQMDADMDNLIKSLGKRGVSNGI